MSIFIYEFNNFIENEERKIIKINRMKMYLSTLLGLSSFETQWATHPSSCGQGTTSLGSEKVRTKGLVV